ncbi:7755_t:CDS:2 [Entrophospora sp. SA101]|nr:7755_t:CDS:2 [Entrophospora sp. SA101]CAJ0825653.1 2535_t:CDS:2 [Entrophospora sp. SA101]CAJ0838188.1 16337_t:CDS:2 [Entrophospora sp. SA101]
MVNQSFHTTTTLSSITPRWQNCNNRNNNNHYLLENKRMFLSFPHARDIAIYAAGWWIFIDAIIYKTIYNEISPIAFEDWIMNTIDKSIISDEIYSYGESRRTLWKARLLILLGFTLMAFGLCGSVAVFVLDCILTEASVQSIHFGIVIVVQNFLIAQPQDEGNVFLLDDDSTSNIDFKIREEVDYNNFDIYDNTVSTFRVPVTVTITASDSVAPLTSTPNESTTKPSPKPTSTNKSITESPPGAKKTTSPNPEATTESPPGAKTTTSPNPEAPTESSSPKVEETTKSPSPESPSPEAKDNIESTSIKAEATTGLSSPNPEATTGSSSPNPEVTTESPLNAEDTTGPKETESSLPTERTTESPSPATSTITPMKSSTSLIETPIATTASNKIKKSPLSNRYVQFAIAVSLIVIGFALAALVCFFFQTKRKRVLKSISPSQPPDGPSTSTSPLLVTRMYEGDGENQRTVIDLGEYGQTTAFTPTTIIAGNHDDEEQASSSFLNIPSAGETTIYGSSGGSTSMVDLATVSHHSLETQSDAPLMTRGHSE